MGVLVRREVVAIAIYAGPIRTLQQSTRCFLGIRNLPRYSVHFALLRVRHSFFNRHSKLLRIRDQICHTRCRIYTTLLQLTTTEILPSVGLPTHFDLHPAVRVAAPAMQCHLFVI